MDKTGTITEGRPRVTKVVSVNSTDETEIVRIAAAIDTHSEHPLAQAVVDTPKRVVSISAQRKLPGAALDAEPRPTSTGIITSSAITASRTNWRSARRRSRSCSRSIEDEAQSVVVVGHKPHADCNGEVLGILAVGDAMRANAPDAIRSLHRAGVHQDRHAQRRQPAHRQRHREDKPASTKPTATCFPTKRSSA